MLVTEMLHMRMDAPTDNTRGDLEKWRVADERHLFNILVMASNKPEMGQ